MRGRKLVGVLVALGALGCTADVAATDDPAVTGAPASDSARGDASGSGAKGRHGAESDDRNGNRGAGPRSDAEDRSGRPERHRRAHEKSTTRPKSTAEPDPAPEGSRYVVTRVIDGDTLELGNGAGVRIVGIDTPEVGECGYDAATANMVRLVLNRQVRLVTSDEDTDRYGRWLRYVDVGGVDAGLEQIRGGFAIARYDSRDGYGFHVREPRYVAADRASGERACAKPSPAPAPAGGGAGCAPGYDPCVPPFPPDADCADVDGPVRVTGADPHGLDADGDGVACE